MVRNVLSIEKVKGIGYNYDLDEFSLYYPNMVYLVERPKIKFSCNFDFKNFPKDSHTCDFILFEKQYWMDKLITRTFYKISQPYASDHVITPQSKKPLNLKTPKIQYDISVEINPMVINTFRNTIRFNYTAASITLHLRRKSFGVLVGSFYVPTGIFAVLSMASYVINPDMVNKNV